ncbi:MAG: BatA domain-containing protein, partial [Chitinispirillaceae bacterium]|nr:BatA domain-containing protein [Chitinispirillaceae bacterium]
MNGLVFLEPTFLWAIFGTIIVIGIHFLKRPKTTTLYFSTLRFFDKATISSYKAEKIRKWLLLFVRIAIFILIILLFANPSCNRDRLSLITNLQNELYILVDPTPSMSYKVNNTTLGDSAIAIIDTIVKLRNSKEGVFVYNYRSNTFQNYSEQEFKNFYLKYYLDKRQLLIAIENTIKSSKRPIFLVFSDFQEESSLFFESIFSNSLLEKIPLIFVPLTPDNPSNVAIVDVNNDNTTENRLYVKTSVEGKKSYPVHVTAIFETIRNSATRCTLSRDTT